jgi:hypothetical protein
MYSHSGEIRRLLDAGWKELGLPILAQEIEEALSLRESEMRSLDALRATRVGWVIATVFGLVAVPGLADQVVIPIWHILKIHPITDVDHVKVVAAIVAIGGIALILFVSLFFSFRLFATNACKRNLAPSIEVGMHIAAHPPPHRTCPFPRGGCS